MAADVTAAAVAPVSMDPLVTLWELVEREAAGVWAGDYQAHMAWKRVVLYLQRIAQGEAAVIGKDTPRLRTSALLGRIVQLTRECKELRMRVAALTAYVADLEAGLDGEPDEDEAGASVDGIRTVPTAGELL